MPFLKRESFTAALLTEKIQKILNSNEEFLLDGNLDCLVAYVPAGGINSSRTYIDKSHELRARSLVVGKAYLDLKKERI